MGSDTDSPTGRSAADEPEERLRRVVAPSRRVTPGETPPAGEADAEGPRVSIAAALAEDELHVLPGGEAGCEIAVSNNSRIVDQLSLEVAEPVGAWASVTPPAINVMPDTERSARVSFTPPRSPEVAAGQHAFQVRVASAQDPDVVVAEAGVVEVASFVEVAAEISPQTSYGPGVATHRVTVTNNGNTAVQAALTARDPDGVLAFDLPAHVSVGRGASESVELTVSATEPLRSGREAHLPFTVEVAYGEDDPVLLHGVMVHEAGPLAASLSSRHVRAEAGNAAGCELKVTNQGRTPLSVRLEVVEAAVPWISVEPETTTLEPSTSRMAIVRFAPPRSPEAVAGTHRFGVRVIPLDQPGEAVVEHGFVDVEPFVHVDVDIDPQQSRLRRRRAVHRLNAHNRGNTAVSVAIKPTEQDGLLDFDVTRKLILEPGTATTVDLTARTTRRIVSASDRPIPFTVHVDPDRGEPIALEAVTVHQPTVRRWLPRASRTAGLASRTLWKLGILLVLVALLVVIAAGVLVATVGLEQVLEWLRELGVRGIPEPSPSPGPEIVPPVDEIAPPEAVTPGPT